MNANKVLLVSAILLTTIVAGVSGGATWTPSELDELRSLSLAELEPVPAQVVRAALEQGDARRPPERRADRGQIAVVELVLKGACPGRDDDAPAG